MNGPQDITEDQRAAYDTAISEAAGIFAQSRCDRDQLAADHGPRAVAEAAMWPGHRPVRETEALYRALQDRERKRVGRKAA
jgi:hypothetical protein